MQRRRRSKAVPKDIFGNAPKPAPAKKEAPSTAVPAKPTVPPTAIPAKPIAPPTAIPAKPTVPTSPKPPPSVESTEGMHGESVTESDTNDELTPTVEDEVIESQILGVNRRKSIGLRPREGAVIDDKADDGPSNKAQALINESRVRAEVEEKKRDEPKTVAGKVTIEAPKPKTPAPKPRRRRNSFQPAARAKRLDRSRHMEYKYEMRGLLNEIDIPEEHRSNILGTIWARGERQTVADAKEFISEKCEQGVLTEEQESTLNGVVDRYTVRR